MAVAGERQVGCEGCGRTVRVDELTTVQMPNGETVACCSACVSHAKAAAEKSAGLDQRRRTCDGCADEFLETELQAVTLSDGTTIDCCRSCAATAPGQDATDASSADTTESDNPGSSGNSGASDETTGADPADTDTALCQQCNEWVEEELFRVTTIDGRNERLCSSCKARAEDDGIIRDVDMRQSEAREVLGVEEDASPERIREAYHRQVKRAHPDQPSGSRSAFQLVKDAYDRLQDERDGY